MSLPRIALITLLSISLSNVYAQGDSPAARPDREFLKSVNPQDRANLMQRRGLEILSEEYFAKPGRFEIFEFDIDVLESKNEEITFSPGWGHPIEIVSQGIKREPSNGWYFGIWTGEIEDPNSKEMREVKWFITTWALNSNDQLIPPDPNREVTRKLLESENHVVSKESVERLDEELVYAITAKINVPPNRTHIRILQPENDLKYLMVYEVDEDKWIPTGNGNVVGPDLSTEIGRLRHERLEGYEAHVESVKRELGLETN